MIQGLLQVEVVSDLDAVHDHFLRFNALDGRLALLLHDEENDERQDAHDEEPHDEQGEGPSRELDFANHGRGAWRRGLHDTAVGIRPPSALRELDAVRLGEQGTEDVGVDARAAACGEDAAVWCGHAVVLGALGHVHGDALIIHASAENRVPHARNLVLLRLRVACRPRGRVRTGRGSPSDQEDEHG